MDWRFAYRRVKSTFCGLSPSFAEMEAFDALDTSAQQTEVHEALDGCLESPFWILRALPRLADWRIRPIEEVSADGSGEVARLGDYNDDYRLFVWVMSGDRDVRDLLLATYHVELNEDTTSFATAL